MLEVLETVEIQRVVDAQPMRSRCSTLIALISIFVATPERWIRSRGSRATCQSAALWRGINVARIVTFDGDREEAFAGEATPWC